MAQSSLDRLSGFGNVQLQLAELLLMMGSVELVIVSVVLWTSSSLSPMVIGLLLILLAVVAIVVGTAVMPVLVILRLFFVGSVICHL